MSHHSDKNIIKLTKAFLTTTKSLEFLKNKNSKIFQNFVLFNSNSKSKAVTN